MSPLSEWPTNRPGTFSSNMKLRGAFLWVAAQPATRKSPSTTLLGNISPPRVVRLRRTPVARLGQWEACATAVSIRKPPSARIAGYTNPLGLLVSGNGQSADERLPSSSLARRESVWGAEVAGRWPLAGESHQSCRRRAPTAWRLLHRCGQRRRLAHGRPWAHLDADLRRPADRKHRRDRGGALEPGGDLRRQRRGPAAAGPLDRRRSLQVRGRGPDLEAPRPARRAADPADRRGPEGSGPPLRRGPRSSLRTQRRARNLPFGGRRRDVPAGPLQGSGHRRRRRGDRSRQSRGRLRGPLGIAAGALGERTVLGLWQRPLQVGRRRDHLEEADERPAGLRARRARADRDRNRAVPDLAPLRHGAGEAGGLPLSLR